MSDDIVYNWNDYAQPGDKDSDLNMEFSINSRENMSDGSYTLNSINGYQPAYASVATCLPVKMTNPICGHYYLGLLEKMRRAIWQDLGVFHREWLQKLDTVNGLLVEIHRARSGQHMDTLLIAYDQGAYDQGAVGANPWTGGKSYLTSIKNPKQDKYWNSYMLMSERARNGDIWWGIPHNSPDRPGAQD